MGVIRNQKLISPVRLSYESYFFSEEIVFFFHDNSANNTFQPNWLILIDLLQIAGRSIIKAEKCNATIALLLCSSSNRCLNFLEEKPELSPSRPVHHHHY